METAALAREAPGPASGPGPGPTPGPAQLLHLQQEPENIVQRERMSTQLTNDCRASQSRSRWRNMDLVSLSITQPRGWQADLAAAHRSFIRQILGLNPFKTSYFALYGPLKDLQSRLLLFAGVVLAVAAGVPLPIIGVVFGKIINSFPPSEEELRVRLGQLMGVASAYFLVTWGWAVCWGLVGERVSLTLRESLVERALGMEQAYFDVEAPDMSNILTEKTQTVQLGTSEKVGLFIQSISYFVAAFTVGFILDAELTGVLFAAIIPLMTLIVCFGAKMVSKFSNEASKISREATNLAESAIRAVQVVQAFGAEQLLSEDYVRLLVKSSQVGIRKAIAGGLMLGSVYFVAYAANALAFWQGRRAHIKEPGGSGEAGTIYTIVFLILDASFVVGQFGPFIQTFALAASAGESIFAVLHHTEAHINVYSKVGSGVDRRTLQEDVAFHNVTFVYPARPTVRTLDQLNVKFKAGCVNGIVGGSGSGKSTIAALLLRLYDPSSGKIVIGDTDLRSFNVRSLRSMIALVDQESVLFSGTILDNLKHGLGDKNQLGEDVILRRCEDALLDAYCTFVADLPEGVYTKVGDSGNTQLSGGQKQRLCLARALVSNPALLILDEFTSAMDATSESTVLEALKRSSAASGRTTIVIAHRLATVKDADNIFVLGSGSLLEYGRHEDLIEANGSYRALIDAQRFDRSSTGSKSPSVYSPLASSPSTKTEKEIFPTIELPPNQNQNQVANGSLNIKDVLRQCLSMSRPEAPFIATGLFFSIISGAIIIGESVVFGNLVQILNSTSTSSDSTARSNFFCLMFFVLALIALFSYTISGSSFGYISEKFMVRVQRKSLETILTQDPSWFHKPGHSCFALMSRLSTDVGHISGLSGVILGTLFSVCTSVIGGIILAHAVAWKIAIVLLAAVPVMLLAGFLRLRVLAKAEQRHQNAYKGAAALASEACAAMRTVAALGREGDVLRQYKDALKKPYEEGLHFIIFGNVLLAFSLAITYFVYALAYWWGSKQVRDGNYSILEFFIVLPALLFSAQAAGQMFSLAPEITRAGTAAKSVLDLHGQTSSIILDSSSKLLCESLHMEKVHGKVFDKPGSVILDNVSLVYESRPDSAALRNVSININSGEFVAFVGSSGAGKSSTIGLIERFSDPTAGKIYVDGEDISQIPVQRHRSRLSLVEQEPDLFPGSIMYNVKLGACPGQAVGMDEVIDVCKRCGLHDFVMSLPEGYSTDCGANGSHLSGGQRQRIAIARAIIRDPQILLLDEATSQLDSQTEQEIRRAVAAASSGRTTIMVAHRLASIQNADCIYVFEGGQIAERGCHEELLAEAGIYAKMVLAQELG